MFSHLPSRMFRCQRVGLFTRGRGLAFTFARVLVGAHVDGRGFPPTDIEDHTSCVPCSHGTLTAYPPHMCHRQRDWAVTIGIGSHMQQDMGISWAPPHLGAPFPLFDAVHVRKP